MDDGIRCDLLRLFLTTLLFCLSASTALADVKLNRSGYIAVSIDPILYESNLWETSHRISLDRFFTNQARDLGEALAEGLEKTTFRGRLRVVSGYRLEDQAEFREKGRPETFLITVDIRSRYGLTKSSPAAACLSGMTCLLLSSAPLFTYETRTEATVTAFYFTREGRRLRLVQENFSSQGKMSGDFYDAMDMTQELEWITHLTRNAIEDIRRKILAELPTELVSRSWRKAAEDLRRAPSDVIGTPGLPPEPEIAATPVKPPVRSGKKRRKELAGKPLNLQDLVRLISPSILKVRTERSIGSGFAISRRGFALTSLHVVDKTTRITVQGHGGQPQRARVVQRYPELDLAVLAIDGPVRGTARLGDSASLEAGDEVIAIGYPLDVGLSITPTRIEKLENWRGQPLIRIEATVPDGSAGGPLVNNRGEVVGIIFHKQEDGTRQGAIFALPISSVRGSFEQFLDFSPE
ncbi:trypsin-like peptidase [Geothermobacter ehrlichii]|uniref:Trypsin-like peptidase n=1 Tax=Geothermobacter ehrlichii TaxID=213224 RepID=A0A5D3WNA0_9BACT|nr:serine protease [Geothermobacter ehrlichii]TYO98805.1 trypsin-like peptidase [Geothermobacter ehrlichii]